MMTFLLLTEKEQEAKNRLSRKLLEKLELALLLKKINTMITDYPNEFMFAAGMVLAAEGGYVDRLDDAGGPTKYGISLRFLRTENIDINNDGVIDKQDVIDLTADKAVELYYIYIWSKNSYERIDSAMLAWKVFDQSLPLGPHEANMILQRAVNNVVEQINKITRIPQSLLVVDGLLGDESIELINSREVESPAILKEFKIEAEKVYREIIEKNPIDQANLDGWLKRLKWSP